jgi:uncharacterized membrane-anchored protein
MNNFLNKKYYLVVLLYAMSLFVSFAQSIHPPNPNPPPIGEPIDGGILILSIVALIYGVSKKK